MRRTTRAVVAAVVAAASAGALVAFAIAGDEAKPAAESPLALAKTIPLPDVRGRIDHLALDAKRGRLFVAALGNGSVEVVSLARGERTSRFEGLEEPQGVAFVAECDRLAAACGGDGTVRVWDADGLTSTATVKLGSDADNVRWNAATKRLWVGFGDGGIAAVDLAAGKETSRVVLDTHPEGFEVASSGKRAFVNLASRGEVAVCDLESRTVTARWKLGGASANFPMALDEAARRLYVGCRSPSRLVVLSTDDGQVAAAVECSGDPDDICLDAARRRAYVVCGAGSIDVFDLTAEGPKLRARVPTERGARTGLFDAATSKLHLAVPRRGSSDAEVRVYDAR